MGVDNTEGALRLPLQFDSRVCQDPVAACEREWLETNGIGGFASSTLIGLNTRRYHGLLVAAMNPPLGRMVLLSKLEEVLIVDGARFELSSNQYLGAVHPQGFRYLESLALDPFPVFTYAIDAVQIQKRLFLVHGENTAVVRYRFSARAAQRACTLEVRPLVAFRDFHNMTRANDAIRRQVDVSAGLASVTPYPGLPALHFAHNAESIDTAGFWLYNFQYDRERERGLDHLEDLYSPFLLRFDLAAGQGADVIASTSLHSAADAGKFELREIERRRAVVAALPRNDPFQQLLTTAAGQFIVARGAHKTVIAGYPWFGDWGRDTMIALPGLTLVTGRYDEARDILRAYAETADHGMLPNRFPETGGTPEYNTVDATLWLFHAVHEFLRYTRDFDFVRAEIYATLADIIDWHQRGTRHGIQVDSDGLLRAGEPGSQLTWMDAMVGGRPVIQRAGKPVEIQALWHNALRVMEGLAQRFGDGDAGRRYGAMAERAHASFLPAFWNETEGCLYDVITDAAPDVSIRPNQVFAVSLPFALIEGERALRILEVIEWELLTPYGLRTLAPRDPRYRGRYDGDPASRDSAYHEGTVWPWLLGPFLTAYIKVHGRTPEVRRRVDRFLDSLRDHLLKAGIGQISEVFDGDPPHHPGGCIAQAWSVAEVLRAYIENVKDLQVPSPFDAV